METKTFRDLEVKTSPEGRFTALVASFGRVDKHGDIIRRGAFAESISEWQSTDGKLPVVFSHQSHDPAMFVGDVDPADVRETDRGLVVNGRLYLGEERAAKVFQQLQRKVLRDWSIGFVIREMVPRKGGRELVKVHLLEVGPTLIGAGDTETLDTKAERDSMPGDVAVARSALARVLLAPYQQQLDLTFRRSQLARLR